jgi:hypothetical protein
MRALPLLLLLAGCGGADEAKAPGGGNVSAPAAGLPARAPTAAEIAEMEAAAAALRAYYAALGRRDYRAAWSLREQSPGLDYERFAASFDAYRDYHAGVGTPSLPAEADGWVLIDAPVQSWGRMKNGERFGNVGRVLMKRRAAGGGWKIVP